MRWFVSGDGIASNSATTNIEDKIIKIVFFSLSGTCFHFLNLLLCFTQVIKTMLEMYECTQQCQIYHGQH